MSSSARIRLEHSMFSASTSQQTPTISDLLQDEFTLKILLEQLKALTKDSIIPLNEHRRILDDIYRMIDSTWTLANLEGYDIDNQSDRVQAWTLWRNIDTLRRTIEYIANNVLSPSSTGRFLQSRKTKQKVITEQLEILLEEFETLYSFAMLYVPPRAGTDRRKDELIIAASIGSVLCESSGGGQVDLFQQKKSLIPKGMQSWEPAKEKKEHAQIHPDYYAHKEARNKKCMGSKSSRLAMISSRDKVNPEDVMSDFDSMPNNENHDSLAHQEGICNDFRDEEDPSMHDSEKDIGDDLENEAEFLKTEPCPQPSLTTPNEPGGGALFSGSKKFTINGGAYQAVNGDKYTTINNNNKPTFNTYKIYPGNKRYSPVPSYPPVVPCNPTFPSKRCPRRPRSRWNITTFTHMVNHHYLPAVMYYPMLWTGYIAPIYFPTCPWG